jgi:hypothetical protein
MYPGIHSEDPDDVSLLQSCASARGSVQTQDRTLSAFGLRAAGVFLRDTDSTD